MDVRRIEIDVKPCDNELRIDYFLGKYRLGLLKIVVNIIVVCIVEIVRVISISIDIVTRPRRQNERLYPFQIHLMQ